MNAEAQRLNDLTEGIIGAAIEVHRVLGPGLLEAAYEGALSHELTLRRLPFERQTLVPVTYKGVHLDSNLRLDLLVASSVVVEVKAVESLLSIHEAQLLTYLRLGGWKLGLLINFNVPLLRKGLRRIVNGLPE